MELTDSSTESATETVIIRGNRGRFAPGTRPGPGRPRGSVDLFRTARREAKKAGVSLERLVWGAVRGMSRAARKGDAAAAKVLLDRLCGPVEKAPEVQVNVAAQLNAGPPPPTTAGDLSEYVARFNEVAQRQGLLPGGESEAAK